MSIRCFLALAAVFLSLTISATAANPKKIVLIAGALTLLMMFVVRRTTFGRQVVAIGGNRTASELSGLPVKRVLLSVYVISGLLAALAGWCWARRRPWPFWLLVLAVAPLFWVLRAVVALPLG